MVPAHSRAQQAALSSHRPMAADNPCTMFPHAFTFCLCSPVYCFCHEAHVCGIITSYQLPASRFQPSSKDAHHQTLFCNSQVPALGGVPQRAAPHHVCLQNTAVSVEQWAHGGGQVTAAPHMDDRQGRPGRQDQLHILLRQVGACHIDAAPVLTALILLLLLLLLHCTIPNGGG
jgi:hypothetical protein